MRNAAVRETQSPIRARFMSDIDVDDSFADNDGTEYLLDIENDEIGDVKEKV